MLTFFVSLTHYSIFSSLDSNVLFHHIYENFFFQTNTCIHIHMTLEHFLKLLQWSVLQIMA